MDLSRARAFMTTHARLLDRHRFDGDGEAVLAALEGYRNPDGGYGWGLEPDLRSPESQPGGALHAFEAMADAAPLITPRARELCDWLQGVALPDGGLPFALPVTDSAGVAPFWAGADATTSSLQITSYVAAAAHRVAAHDPAVAGHPWPASATRYCLAAGRALGDAPHALVLVALLQLLDVVHETEPEAPAVMEDVGRLIPADGRLHVAGGAEDEFMRPLDFAPWPGRPVRALFDEPVIAAALDDLAAEQQEDGGWRVDFQNYSPAASLEWRGYATVRAVAILRDNGVRV